MNTPLDDAYVPDDIELDNRISNVSSQIGIDTSSFQQYVGKALGICTTGRQYIGVCKSVDAAGMSIDDAELGIVTIPILAITTIVV